MPEKYITFVILPLKNVSGSIVQVLICGLFVWHQVGILPGQIFVLDFY